MKDAILDKLRSFLITHNPFTEECHVVYLFVEIRKLLSLPSEYENGILRFYCDWSLHTEKTRNLNVIAPIAEGIENSILNGHQFRDGQFLPSNNDAIKFIYKEELLNNMRDLFLQLNLPMDIFEEKNRECFLRLLIQVLVNQPIILDRKIKSLCFRHAIVAANLEVVFNDGERHRFINAF